MRKVKTIFFLIAVIFVSISGSTSQPNEPDYISFKGFRGKTIEVAARIVVGENEVFDGNGNLYDWVGEGDCSQTEGMSPMFVLLSGATLKNIWIRNAPDGIHVKGSNIVVNNMVNVDVCEDAISKKKVSILLLQTS
jgi:hypothetical protein|tara:strand:+ start:68 stop:475 length:408 start_codon:yes stop_codon:yes gene_type:complete